MSIAEPILVTGAAGTVGRFVIRALRRSGGSPLIATRQGQGENEVRFDFCDQASWGPALAPVSRLFLLRPPKIVDIKRTLGPFIRKAREKGVQHIVFLSVVGADKLPFLPHAAVERYLTAASGWTILRPSFFAQNIETAYAEEIINRDRIYVPAGLGKIAFIDARDIGEAAASCLLQPEIHLNKAYTLTGPLAVNFEQVAEFLSSALGRAITYESASAIGYLAHLRLNGSPWSQAMIQTALHVGLRFGQAEKVTTDLRHLIGREPKSVFDYIQDQQRLWRRPIKH